LALIVVAESYARSISRQQPEHCGEFGGAFAFDNLPNRAGLGSSVSTTDCSNNLAMVE
jgi:hypothetical protein